VQLVTLVGEAGVGKTRLLRELGQWLDDEPDLVYWRQGRCLPYGEGIAFWALGEGIPPDWAETEVAWALFDLGEWDDVLARTERLVEGARSVGGLVLEAMVRPTRGRILLARGQVDEARADADASVALVEDTDIPQSIVPSLTLAAGVAAATEDRTRASEFLRELERRTRGRARSRGIEVVEAARIAATVSELEPVELILADSFPPVQRANAQRLAARAVLAEASEAFDDALALHSEAAQAWRAFGHVYEHAHAHAGAGRCVLGRDGGADFAEARRLFERLGAKRHLVELDELLGGEALATG
jgi:tetratricopeptide (TPR) repeat protein